MKTFLSEPWAYVASDVITRCVSWQFEPDNPPRIRANTADDLIAKTERFLECLKQAHTHARL